MSTLEFDTLAPVAPGRLGGLTCDDFAHGRMTFALGAHGGILDLGFFGRQRLGASRVYKGDPVSTWTKCFRPCARINGRTYYLTLNNTRLYPFGYGSECECAGVGFVFHQLLLEDALVYRLEVTSNPHSLPIAIEMIHMEPVTAVQQPNRTWRRFALSEPANAYVSSCRDVNPRTYCGNRDSGLAQKGMMREIHEAPEATTWIGVSGDSTVTAFKDRHKGMKHVFTGERMEHEQAALFVCFNAGEQGLRERIVALKQSVHRDCERLLQTYAARVQAHPQIDLGDQVLNSAFGQYPELIEAMALPDAPGAIRANFGGYYVWGWDGMTPLTPCVFSNEPERVADILRFFHNHLDSEYGIAHSFTRDFGLRLKGPFAAQCQYLAGLYHYVAATHDLALAREVWSTCTFILDHCRRGEVGSTGLVEGNALWPDFPEVMGEDGHDISSLNNSLLYQGLRAMEYLAGTLGEEALAADCADWARCLRKSFIAHLYDEEKGYFITSCSSKDFSPRKHYPCQAVFWLTPFARELVSHAPDRIASFITEHLRDDKCLLSVPRWDEAWMADGNQIGASYPTADYFYLNVHKLMGRSEALEAWLDDISWYWNYHSAPEALTPNGINEAELGPDCSGGKQLQAVTCWYACLYQGLAGIDIDHEGLTLTPWGDRTVDIRGLKLRGACIDLSIRSKGSHIGELKLNGKALPTGSRKLAWSELAGKRAALELTRSEKAPAHPVVVRADGLRVTVLDCGAGRLAFRVEGGMSGEVVVQAAAGAAVTVGGKPAACPYDRATGCVTVAYASGDAIEITIAAPEIPAGFQAPQEMFLRCPDNVSGSC